MTVIRIFHQQGNVFWNWFKSEDIEYRDDLPTFYKMIEKNGTIPLPEFIWNFILKYVILRHEEIGFEKLRQEGKNGFHFTRDENNYLHLFDSNLEPQFKFSKFSFTRDIARDLDLLKDNGIGEAGKNILERIK